MTDDATADGELWERMQTGDTRAWGLLFDRHAQRVYRFCARFLGSAQEAEDALSDTFVEVWRARRSFSVRGDSTLPILLAIARRTCQKRHRSTSRRIRRHDTAVRASDATVEDIAAEVVEADEASRRQAWLRERVAALPTTYRDVYELVIYAELPQEQVARVLDVPLGTVKSRMARARRLLGSDEERHADSPNRVYERTRP